MVNFQGSAASFSLAWAVALLHCTRQPSVQPLHVRSFEALAAAMPAVRQFGGAKPVKGAYILLVSGKLKPGHSSKFISNFRPLAAHVAEHEDDCLAYELSMSEADPDSLIIYERFTNKEYLEEVHWQPEPYKAFQAANHEAGIEWVDGSKQVVRYIEQDLGFADQDSRAFGGNKAVKHAHVLVVSGKLKQGQLQSIFVAHLKALAAHVAQHEPGALVYELSVAEDDPDRFIIYERYTSKDYLVSVHRQSELFKANQSSAGSSGLEWVGRRSAVGYNEQDLGF